MARKRIIDTGIYFDSEICELLGPVGLHVYICLWGISEDSGVYAPNYPDISLQMGALRVSTEEVKKFIEALVNAKKIIPFEADGKTFHWCKNFFKHQPLNNPAVPKLPVPEWIFTEILIYPKSKRKYAKFKVVIDRLPVGYTNITSSLPEEYLIDASTLPVPKETKRNETKRNEIETIDPPEIPGKTDGGSQDLRLDPSTGQISKPPSEAERLSTLLASLILINNPNYRELKESVREKRIGEWAKGFELMLLRDGKDRTFDGAAARIIFCQKDNFWWRNILSGKKFREQYDKLTNDMKDRKRGFNEHVGEINLWLKENGYEQFIQSGTGKNFGNNSANKNQSTGGTGIGIKPQPGEYDRKPTFKS